MNTTAVPTAAAPLLTSVRNILLAPRSEWPVIRNEATTVQSIYTGYLCLIGLVPAIAGFIGMSLVGAGGFGVSFKVPIVTGLVNMVVGYALWLIAAYLLARLVDALAPTFGGRKDFLCRVQGRRLQPHGGLARRHLLDHCRRWRCSACWRRCIRSTCSTPACRC